MTTIVLLSLAGAVISAVVGTLWYSNATPMGKIHLQYLGFYKLSEEEQKSKMEEMKPQMTKMYAAQIALSFLTAFATVFIVTLSVRNGVSLWLATGFVVMNWLCFVVPTIGSAILWGTVDRSIAWQKFFSDILSSLVTMLLIVVLASFFI